MNLTRKQWSEALLRGVFVAGAGILTGLALYQSLIFVPTMKPSQFTESSITAGIAYAALKSPSKRNALAALFVWFVILPLLAPPFHRWFLVLAFVYILGIAAAVYVYSKAVKIPFIDVPVKRVLVAGGLLALGNGMIIVALSLIVFTFSISHLEVVWTNIVGNLKLGALIGLAVGVGIELAEYAIRKISESQVEEGEDKPGTDPSDHFV